VLSGERGSIGGAGTRSRSGSVLSQPQRERERDARGWGTSYARAGERRGSLVLRAAAKNKPHVLSTRRGAAPFLKPKYEKSCGFRIVFGAYDRHGLPFCCRCRMHRSRRYRFARCDAPGGWYALMM
jgi:hypothetical protein